MDSRYRILYLSWQASSSTLDSSAFPMRGLPTLQTFENKGLAKNYWIAANETYVCSQKIVCPCPGRNLNFVKDCFNYCSILLEYSSSRHSEFWLVDGVLCRTKRFKIAKATRIVSVCCKVRNFLIDNASVTSVPEKSGMDNEFRSNPADQKTCLQDTCDKYTELHRRRRDL